MAKLVAVMVVVAVVGVATVLADPTVGNKFASYGFSKYHKPYVLYSPFHASHGSLSDLAAAPYGLRGLYQHHFGVF